MVFLNSAIFRKYLRYMLVLLISFKFKRKPKYFDPIFIILNIFYRIQFTFSPFLFNLYGIFYCILKRKKLTWQFIWREKKHWHHILKLTLFGSPNWLPNLALIYWVGIFHSNKPLQTNRSEKKNQKWNKSIKSISDLHDIYHFTVARQIFFFQF